MALTVEDGSGVAGADSYVSVTDARAFLQGRGLSFTGTDSEVENLLRQAMDLVESFRDRFKGSRTSATQELQWPRSDVYIDRSLLDDDAIPQELIRAQTQLAFDAQTQELQPTGSGQEIVREKVDVIETEYALRGSSTIQPRFNKAMAFLKPLLRYGGGLRTLRV